jgi:hypothetical protein
VNGLNGSVFGQFAYCNAPAFFRAANVAIKGGMLTVPALGTAKDGMPCMSTRDFALIDQDQSDNVTATYLTTGTGGSRRTPRRTRAAWPAPRRCRTGLGRAVTVPCAFPGRDGRVPELGSG